MKKVLKFLTLGETGIGKSTLMDSLFKRTLDGKQDHFQTIFLINLLLFLALVFHP